MSCLPIIHCGVSKLLFAAKSHAMEEMHYKNAPIIEAIIDIRATAAETATEANFDAFAADLNAGYPQSLPLYAHQFTFDASHPGEIEAKGARAGIHIISADGKRQTIINKEGFAFSLLAPYTRWSEFMEAALPVWSAYLSHLQPTTFSRAAVRYVNVFRFAEQEASLPRYFTVYPQVEAINSRFSQHQLRARVELNDTIAAIVTQAHLPSSSEVQILLDLDVFQDRGLPDNANAVWECLLPLRDYKNWLFRQCLTYEGERRIRE